MIDRKLLKGARESLKKEAFVPLTPEAQAAAAGGAPPMDPAMMGGAPPMDPAMMGGAPPMPPMDPAAMGGAPPMDPAMMGGMPPIDPATGMPIDPATGMPMDPAMLGGAPPMPPEEEGDDVVKVSMDDLKALMEEVAGAKAGDAEKPRRATNAEIMDKLTKLETSLSALVGGEPTPADTGMMPPELEGAPMPPGSPEEISALLQSTGMGMPPEGAAPPMPPGMPVQAAAKSNTIASLVSSLKEKQR